ncbi:hypothetical protein TCE0_042f14974 [Talaromyces pinophilus]|uniref:Uncharacterized protein n=1 Tax=Talaromyces pinophilus TaxID=128442 RepID=A0A6V8HL12_TALPI|nr:hypothetical protein TCE0_042f14974 [Talaromyces pinophilus]
MPKTLQPHSMKLVIDWFELEDDAYPDVGLPLGISVFVELQVEPDSVFTVMKGVDGVINFESPWYKGVTKIADKPPKTGVEDVDDQSSNLENEKEQEAQFDAQGDLYSADGLDEGESFASSTKSSDTVRPSTSTITPKPSKIPIRICGTDGAFDDLDRELDLPPSPTLSSRDSLPWHSTKDTSNYSDENGQTGIDLDDLFTDLEDIYQPILRHENGDITLHAAREVEPGFYKVEIAFYRHFQRDTQGWYGVDLCDVVKTCPPIPGKLVFNLQDHPSLATHIVGPDDQHEIEDGSIEATFDPREAPYLAFWAWTHATYLEFWGEGGVDKTYYDDLIGSNEYLDSDELVDYVDFMFKTRDYYMSLPFAKKKEEEEDEKGEDDQVDDMTLDDATVFNVDNVVFRPEECFMTPISEEEESESEEDEDVVWEDPIPDLGNVGCGLVEGSVSSSDEEEVGDVTPEDVTGLNIENIVSESGENMAMPILEEKFEDMVLEEVTALNVEDAVSGSEEAAAMSSVEEQTENVILEDVPTPNIENVASESYEPSKLPTIEEEPENSTLEDTTAPNVNNPPPPSPALPTYTEALEGYEKYQAMMAARAAFRCRALFCLRRVLPALFVSVFVVCACMNGPPPTISTPTNTLHTVRYYANHIGGMGYNALRNVNVLSTEFGQYQEGSAASSEGSEADNCFSDDEEYFLWELVDGMVEREGISDSSAAIEVAESTAESVVSPSALLLDAEMSPPLEIAAEASTPVSESTSTPDLASDIAEGADPETLDHPTTTPPPSEIETEPAIVYLAIKENNLPLGGLCASNPNTPYPPDCPPPPSPREPALTILTGLAKDILRHIACSTSPICTVSRISDKYENPADIFARFQCDGKGGWRPETGRDGFDRFLGWVPEECRLEA